MNDFRLRIEPSKIGGVYGDSVLMRYADQLVVPVNHAGVPGISFPAGFDAEAMPLGIHFLAPDFREDLLFRAGRAYEHFSENEPWRQVRQALTR
jgi:aspartyl-tRNA(Asn)/glutamyl-tRNA(Gln) amidotransferase subunit A